jgi:hypothetical protein
MNVFRFFFAAPTAFSFSSRLAISTSATFFVSVAAPTSFIVAVSSSIATIAITVTMISSSL